MSNTNSKTTYNTSTLTPEQKVVKLASLVAIPEETLRTFKRDNLHETAKGLLPRYKAYLKAELLEVLLAMRASELQRIADLLALEEKSLQDQKKALIKASERSPLESRIVAIKAKLRNLAQDTNTELQLLENVWTYAAEEVTTFRLNYCETTCKDYLSQVRNVLALDETTTSSERYRAALIAFGKAILRIFRESMKAINEAYKVKVTKNSDKNTLVDGNALLAKAIKMIENCPSEPTRNQALDLAIALILVTGRRAAEVLSSAAFKLIPGNSQEVIFTGQLKGKGINKGDESDHAKKLKKVFMIPSLVEPTKLLEAMQKLVASGHRKADPAEVNNCYATSMKRLMLDWLKLAKLEGEEPLTPKSMRAVYANLCIRDRYQGNINGAAVYVASIMGHEDDDQVTAHSYMVWDISGGLV